MRNNLGLFVGKRAKLQPNQEAILDYASGKRLTYKELDVRCNRFGNGTGALSLTSSHSS